MTSGAVKEVAVCGRRAAPSQGAPPSAPVGRPSFKIRPGRVAGGGRLLRRGVNTSVAMCFFSSCSGVSQPTCNRPARPNLPMGTLLFGAGKNSIKCVVFLRTCCSRLRGKGVPLKQTQPEWRRVECSVCIFAAAANVFQIVLLMVIFWGERY